MMIPFLISKIHNGSISIDVQLIEAAGLHEFQKVEVYNIDNGNRFSTYVIPEERGSGRICINGAAAHLADPGNRIIIAAYALLDEKELNSLNSVVLLMKENNQIERVIKRSL